MSSANPGGGRPRRLHNDGGVTASASPTHLLHSAAKGSPTREQEEKYIVEDALRRMPQLDAFPLSPTAGRVSSPTDGAAVAFLSAPSSPVHPLSRRDSSYTLAADDEALLLQELMNITAGAAPFISSAAQEEARADAAAASASPGARSSSDSARVPVAADDLTVRAESAPQPPTTTTAAAAATPSPSVAGGPGGSAAPVGRRHRATPPPPPPPLPPSVRSKSVVLKEEQDILDAILAAVDGQQSSISGDMMGERSGNRAGGGAADRAAAYAAGVPGACVSDDEGDDDVDDVERVLEEARLVASSTVLCETQRDELVLHLHEHVSLRHRLAELRRTVGAPSCVALAECCDRGAASSTRGTATPPATGSSPSSISCAMGTSLGAVVLFNSRWSVLGLCGSVESSVVSARGAVVSLSLCTAATAHDGGGVGEEATAAAGHAKGTFVLWSLRTLSALRVISDEGHVPLLRVAHLHRDPSRVLVLESSGAVRLFQFWRVMSRQMLRSTTVTPASAAAPVCDVDTMPCPSSFYMQNLAVVREHLPRPSSAAEGDAGEDGTPWLYAPPQLPPAAAATAGVSPTTWPILAGKHLVATVSTDAVVVYVVEAGLQGAVTAVARHTHPPTSSLSNELVRFVVLEVETATPRVLLCVSWNTELEVLLLHLRIPEPGRGKTAPDVSVDGLERLALLRLSSPLVQMVPLAGSGVLVCDANHDAQLMDATVAVMVERHHFESLDYVDFSSRLSGVKYHGTAASNHATAILLSKSGAYGISLRSWRERLSSLVARRKFTEALDLAKNFAEEVALAAVGLSSNAASRRRELHHVMERILVAYVDTELAALLLATPNTSATARGAVPQQLSRPTDARHRQHHRAGESLLEGLRYIVSYCAAVDGLDLLYGPVVRALQQRGLLPHLLYVLQQCMRRGVVTYMPEPLVERFVDLFLDAPRRRAVEAELGVRAENQDGGDAEASRQGGHGAGDAAAASPVCASGVDAELALMCLEEAFPTLLRLAQERGLVRLAVTVMSLRQQRYVDALAYALEAEEKADGEGTADGDVELRARRSSTSDAAPTASVAVDLVECTLKDASLLPGVDLPTGELRRAKTAILEYLLQEVATPGAAREMDDYNLLRLLRRRPEHAVRVLLFALSDEGPCSPWGIAGEGLSRTAFVSSVYFILSGGTRTHPRHAVVADRAGAPNAAQPGRLDLFRVDDDTLGRLPGLRLLKAAELAQRSFPPYLAIHTFLAGAAIFGDLFDADDGDYTGGGASTQPPARFDVWIDLVIQDTLFTFQRAETLEERLLLQDHLLRVLGTDTAPMERVAVYQPDFARLRMARCVAALWCREQRYTEAIACYTDPVQNRVDARLQHDVFPMLRLEMQRLQDERTRAMNRAQQELSRSPRLTGAEPGEEDDGGDGASGAGWSAAASDGTASLLSREPSKTLVPAATAAATTTAAVALVEAAIKALQRAVMGHVEVLVRIDATALAQFIFDYLPSNHREVMRLLRGSSAAFLDYLDELMAHGDSSVASDMNLQNTYIELLCAHAPRRVHAHLLERGARVTYDVQLALRAVRKHHIADASVYLLEKTMMIDEAVSVMLRAVRELLATLREEVLTHLVVGAEAPSPVVDVAAFGGAQELSRFVAVGEELCAKYQADRVAGGASQRTEYWFRLLDVFMVPRRLLCEAVAQDDRLRRDAASGSVARRRLSREDSSSQSSSSISSDPTGMGSELDLAAHASASVLPLHLPPLAAPLADARRRRVEALVSVYTHYTSTVLRAMMRSLDLAVVVDKVVQDNKDDTFRAFKPVILDMMTALRFDLEANRLCAVVTEDDVTLLGRELHQRLTTGVVPQSDCCAFCHAHLSEPPPASSSSSHGIAGAAVGDGRHTSLTSLTVSVYTCGHAFHTVCAVSATGPRPGCWACAQRRFAAEKLGDHASGADVVLVAAAEPTLDVARMQRRMRQTKMRMDHAEDLYPLLKSFLAYDTAPSAARSSGAQGAPAAVVGASGARWVLAPPPPVPVEVGDVAVSAAGAASAAEDTALSVETLTDAEILELFGGL
ncbi:hypothetical protein NESM_000113200 [Novymonas esmeraldas]|uniref:RING-type domain-containing protein n=1 Tax=Novymonas esmeraldas TaxID=1808958 RepID=A0AAW0F2D7_9TRYP